METKCKQCGRDVHNSANVNIKYHKKFCNQTCSAKYNNTHRKKHKKICEDCGAQFETKYLAQRFCSIKCGGRLPSLEEYNICTYYKCNNRVSRLHAKFCDSCCALKRHHFAKWDGRMHDELTKGDICKRVGANRYDSIRGAARTRYMKINPLASCEECGWDKHIEVAHIKPISAFSDDTIIDDINDPSNVRGLCPNCHWIFDHLKRT